MFKRLIIFFLFAHFFTLSSVIGQNRYLNFSSDQSNSVNKNDVLRKINDDGLKGMQVNYNISCAKVFEKKAISKVFQYVNIKDFTYLKEVGKPALPAHYDLVLIPDGADISISTGNLQRKTYDDFLIYPALKPATDREGDPEPPFEIDEQFYQSDVSYPDQPVKIVETLLIRGLRIAVIQVCPIQYNPLQKRITVYPNLNYHVEFSQASKYLDASRFSNHFLEMLPNYILNSVSLKKEIAENPIHKNVNGPAVNYIIITHSNYIEAADSLAKWKAQLGYTVEIVSKSSWTSAQVKSEIQQRYQNWNPKPDYFVILGDHDLVPGEIHQDPTYSNNFATDLYYACMDGAGDYVADMAFGRISVSSAAQALSVVQKIIHYEKNPPAQAAFYNSAVACAQFEDEDSNSYEDRRFALTAEEIRDYMTTQQGFNIDRVYKTDNYVTPLYWNDGFFANSEPVPTYLRKPTYAWDDDKYDIRDYLNSADGRLFILHRDHGYSDGTGWATPEFLTSDISMLNNGDRTPVVFSINCNTGEYLRPECFSERFLRYNNGGAVGVFGASYISYSGFNDALLLGMIDAIWSNPGIIPNFTGIGDTPVGLPTVHNPIYNMGDVMNQGMIRMVQTWGDDSYTHELFHYFGDPAMQMWTAIPVNITATHTDSLFCNDTVFNIYSCSLADGLATLVVNGELIAETTLSGGTGTLTFPPFGGSEAVLTISEHNFKPYVANIPVNAGCVRADFDISYTGLCIGENITFTDASDGSVLSWSWNFGSGASPASASSQGPHTVVYATAGMKTISLTVTGSAGSNIYSQQISVPQLCSNSLSQNTHISAVSCNGILLDNGGSGNYLSNSNDTAIISATGATSIQIAFNDFDVEPGSLTTCDYDYLSIYDGPNTSATLLGTYCNTNGNTPPATLTTSGNNFTVVFHSDAATNMRGFEIEWSCSVPNSPPNTSFSASPLNTCTGEVNFSDLSLNNPTSWLWDFGDGDTSTIQNPNHIYVQNGIFTITLSATNIHGTTSYTRIDYINVNRPNAPLADSGMICNSGSVTLHANGSGNLSWYDQSTGGNLLGTGSNFITPTLSSTTTYFVQDQVTNNFFVEPADTNLGSGGFYTGSTSHYLKFDALNDFTLVSVKVFAANTKDRTIELRNSSGVLIYDTIVNITAGDSRIYLNYFIPAGNNYRLVCAGTNCQLYRNNSGAVFPYSVPDIVSITGNSFTDPTFYYYFYDWEVRGSSCISPRTEVPVFISTAIPNSSFSFSQNLNTVNFTDLSTDAYFWTWDFDDGYISHMQNPSHTYMANGMYIVNLTAENGCGQENFADTVYVYTVGINTFDQSGGFIIYPNPASSIIYISSKTGTNNIEEIRLTDITGRSVLKIENIILHGNMTSIDLSGLSSGLYMLSIRDSRQNGLQKIIKY
jgi:PKD repeat protein